MALGWWGKGLWQICMHHWTAYAKVEFPRFPPDVRTGRSIPQLLITELRNEFKNFSNHGESPFHNFWPWTQKWKFGIDIFYGVSSNHGGVHSTHFKSAPWTTENSKFKNFPMVLSWGEKRLFHNLHASLDSICRK